MSDDAKKMDEVLEEEVIEETSEACEDAELAKKLRHRLKKRKLILKMRL